MQSMRLKSKIAGLLDYPHELFPVQSAVLVLVRLRHYPTALILLLPQLLSHSLQVSQPHESLPHLVIELERLPQLLLLVPEILPRPSLTNLAVMNFRKTSLVMIPFPLSSRYSIICVTCRLSISYPNSFMLSMSPVASMYPL
jgi:hypothetical protein